MAGDNDQISKISLIHGLLKREVEELIRLFDPSSKRSMMETSFPLMDAVVRGGGIVVYVEMPGVDLEDFTVYQVEDLLVIEGVKRIERIPGNVNFLRMERDFSPFRRILHLPFAVDKSRTAAKLKDGVLVITLQRGSAIVESQKPKE